MVKVFKHTHRYDDPPQTVLLAFYLRYPNPYASHVLTCDVLSRTIDPLTGTLRTTRLILKKGIVPRWARSWLEGFVGGGAGAGLEAWVLEESEVRHDGLEVSLRSWTRNISHARLMQIIEGTDLEPVPESPEPFGSSGTYHHTTAAVRSDFGGQTTFSSLIRGRIESYGAARFAVNAEKAREGMSLILELLRTNRPLPNTVEAGASAGGFSDLLRGRGRHLFGSDEDAAGNATGSDQMEDKSTERDDPSATNGYRTGSTDPSSPPSFFSRSPSTSSSLAPPSSNPPQSFFLSPHTMHVYRSSGPSLSSSSLSPPSRRSETLMSIRQREKSRAQEEFGTERQDSITVEEDIGPRPMSAWGVAFVGLGLYLGRRARRPRASVISRRELSNSARPFACRNFPLRGGTNFLPHPYASTSGTPCINTSSTRSLHVTARSLDLDSQLNELLKLTSDDSRSFKRGDVPASRSWAQLPSPAPPVGSASKSGLPTNSRGNRRPPARNPQKSQYGDEPREQQRQRQPRPNAKAVQQRDHQDIPRSRPPHMQPREDQDSSRAPNDVLSRPKKAFGFRDQVRQARAGASATSIDTGFRAPQSRQPPVYPATTRFRDQPTDGQARPRSSRSENPTRRTRDQGLRNDPARPARSDESTTMAATVEADDVETSFAFDDIADESPAHHERRMHRVDPRAPHNGKKRKDSRGPLVPSAQGKIAFGRPGAAGAFGRPVFATEQEKKKVKRVDPDVKVEKEVFLPLSIRVADLARLLDVKLFKLQRRMENLGLGEQDCHPDNQITSDFSSLIAQEYGLKPVFDEERSFDIFPDPPTKDHSSLPIRPPVVTIMGHVDHGKTTLLDSLRHTAVAAGEAGGITQHIGAFSVSLSTMLDQSSSASKSDASITFLDTPGHAAFSAMRARGAHVTDIVVLVVAADDGVMPQTKEVINLVQAEGDHVGLVVVINKIDKPGVDLAKVKSALGAEGILLEEDGGDVPSVRVSGLAGIGLAELVETLATVAEVRDLRASRDTKAEGYVLESRIEKGRGNVATVLVSRGTLKQGSSIVAGQTWCRVRQITDDKGKVIPAAYPGMPVTVTGWRDLPTAGDELLEAIKGEDEAKKAVENRKRDQERKALMRDVEQINEKRRIERERLEEEEKIKAALEASGAVVSGSPAPNPSPPSTTFKELLLVIRADVSGTVEAVVGALEGIGNKEAGVKIVHTGVGDVSEADVAMADAIGGNIIGFSVSAPRKVREQAAAARVDLQLEDVIYRLIETVRGKVAALLPPVIETRVLGEAVVQQIFKIDIKGKDPATIAGCRVGNGVIGKNDVIRVLRGDDREIVHEGPLDSLKHVKKDVTEAKKGSECGLSLAGWAGIQEGDVVTAVQKITRPREL